MRRKGGRPGPGHLALTFVFVALVAALLILGQFFLLALLLIACLLFAPRITEWVTQAERRVRKN
ncbi:MAG: hypothetical protein Kow0032_21350 [Methyloligellaceae bacterium]